jgi:hypothetical protein
LAMADQDYLLFRHGGKLSISLPLSATSSGC